MEDFGILEQIVPADFPLPAKFEQRQVKDDTEYEKVYSTIIQYNKTCTLLSEEAGMKGFTFQNGLLGNLTSKCDISVQYNDSVQVCVEFTWHLDLQA